MKPEWISPRVAFAIHDAQISEHGGKEGIRDLNALKSALARPQNLLAYSTKRPSLFELAAAYATGIARNHPFTDGNKRVALALSLAFLELNGIETDADEDQLAALFEQLAAGTLKEPELVTWFETTAVLPKKPPKKAR